MGSDAKTGSGLVAALMPAEGATVAATAAAVCVGPLKPIIERQEDPGLHVVAFAVGDVGGGPLPRPPRPAPLSIDMFGAWKSPRQLYTRFTACIGCKL